MADNIYRRGSTWWGRLTYKGVEYRRSLRTTDEAEARSALEVWRAEVARAPTGYNCTWQEAVVNWADTIGSITVDDGGLKANVKKRYWESVRMIDPFWRNLRLSDIGRAQIADFVKARKKGFVRKLPDGTVRKQRPVTNATIRRDLTSLSSVFRAAKAANLCDHNPAADWDREVIPERRRVMVPPLPHEIETVARYATGNLARLILFAANTGMRLREAVGIEWRDVREGREEVLLPRTKVSRPRTISLRTPGGDAVGTLVGTPRHIRSPLVFWHEVDGVEYGNPSGAFRKVMDIAVAGERAEGRELRRFTFHSMRHAFAIRWLMAGGDIYQLSRHLGHTSVKTTEIYLGFITDYQDEQARHKLGTGAVVSKEARTG